MVFFFREILYGDFIIDDWFQALNWPTSNNYCTALRSEKSHTSYTIDRQCVPKHKIYFTRFITARLLIGRLFIHLTNYSMYCYKILAKFGVTNRILITRMKNQYVDKLNDSQIQYS